MVDHEFSGNFSTRKLVIETGKSNVVTAYSAEEALDTLEKFSGADGVVVDDAIPASSVNNSLPR